MGGRIVYGAGPFKALDPPPVPISPDWSPVKFFGGVAAAGAGMGEVAPGTAAGSGVGLARQPASWGLGCDCFAG